MANYYSNSNPSFTPYIKQYDDDLLLKGSALKQSQYDTNYARIQSSLDKADELEILNPFQQQYKDTKLKEVTSKLNQISGSDFSSNAIVNNALGIASTVAKDPIVSSGLLSTQRIKAQMADRKRLRKEGKYNEITEYYDNKLVNAYVNDSNLDTSFKGSSTATEWFDAPKALADAITAKNPDLEVQIGNYGQLERFTDKSKSRTPEQIKNIIATELQNDPRIGKMIGIIGDYNYRDLDAPTLLKHVERNVNNIKESYDATISQFEKNTALNNKNASTNAKVIAQLKAERDAWIGSQTEKGYIPGYFDTIKEDILNGDLDRAKSTFQTQSFITNAIQKYTVNDHDITIDVPEIVKFNYTRQQDAIDNALKAAQFQEQLKQNAITNKLKAYELQVDIDANGNPIVIKENAPESGSYTEQKHQDRITQIEDAVNGQLKNLKSQWDKVTANNPLYNPATYDPKKNGGALLNQKKEEDFRTYVATNEYARVNNLTNQLDPYYMDWYNQNKEILAKQHYYSEVKKDIEKKALEQHPLTGGVVNPATNVHLNYNSQEASVVDDIYKEIESLKTLERARSLDEGSRTGYSNLNAVLINKIEQYKKDPQVYNKLKQLASKGYDNFKDFATAVDSKLKNVAYERKKYKEEQYKTKGFNLNAQDKIVHSKIESDKLLKIVTALPTEVLKQAGVKTDPKDPNTRGLSVKSVGRDPVTQEFYVNVVDAANNVRQIKTNVSNAEMFVPTNPYGYIEEQLVSRGHTSYDPAGALVTENGKLSYGIDTDRKGKYVFLIGPGGTPIKTEYRAGDIAKIDQTMNMLSIFKNKKTNKPFTREEIVEMLNNPDLIQNIEINAK